MQKLHTFGDRHHSHQPSTTPFIACILVVFFPLITRSYLSITFRKQTGCGDENTTSFRIKKSPRMAVDSWRQPRLCRYGRPLMEPLLLPFRSVSFECRQNTVQKGQSETQTGGCDRKFTSFCNKRRHEGLFVVRDERTLCCSKTRPILLPLPLSDDGRRLF